MCTLKGICDVPNLQSTQKYAICENEDVYIKVRCSCDLFSLINFTEQKNGIG